MSKDAPSETWYAVLDPHGRSVLGTLSSHSANDAKTKFMVDRWDTDWSKWEYQGYRVAVANVEWRTAEEPQS